VALKFVNITDDGIFKAGIWSGFGMVYFYSHSGEHCCIVLFSFLVTLQQLSKSPQPLGLHVLGNTERPT